MKIVAIANQKGGVAKTTTAINLAAGLAEVGRKVLVIDMDPQGNASTGFGVGLDQRSTTIYDLLLGEADPASVVVKTATERVHIMPSTTELSSSDIQLHNVNKRSFLLKDSLESASLKQFLFDYVLIDCPPSLNLLTVNALVAAHSVLIPLQSEFFALEGLSQLMLTIREIRETANSSLRVEGVLLTMHDQRNNLSQQVEKDARDTLGGLVYQTVIPRNVRLSEAPSYAIPALAYDSASKGSVAYRAFSREFLANNHDLPEELAHG
ncbi:AAA family ATPase [Pararhodobacter sp.]|uniref:ParA family protein n=1 Tax=Pararhodobacter sp. TaxID=2127056 RepID=UPI002AFEB4B6|nr:AAA family ATPase [Pararhodobacter sp.]